MTPYNFTDIFKRLDDLEVLGSLEQKVALGTFYFI